MVEEVDPNNRPVIITKRWSVDNDLILGFILALFIQLLVFFQLYLFFHILVSIIWLILSTYLMVLGLRLVCMDWLPSKVILTDRKIDRYYSFLSTRSIYFNEGTSVEVHAMGSPKASTDPDIDNIEDHERIERLRTIKISDYIHGITISDNKKKIDITIADGWTEDDIQLLWTSWLADIMNNQAISLGKNFKCIISQIITNS